MHGPMNVKDASNTLLATVFTVCNQILTPTLILYPRLLAVPTSEFGYTSATAGGGDHEV